MREYYITKNDSGQRLNKFLEKAVPLLSGGMMHKYLRLKRIKVNNKRTEAAYKLAEGNSVLVLYNGETSSSSGYSSNYARVTSCTITVTYIDAVVWYRDGSTWRQCTVWYRLNGAWKQVVPYYNSGGAWVRV